MFDTDKVSNGVSKGELAGLLGNTALDPGNPQARSEPLPLSSATSHLFPAGRLRRGSVLGISGGSGVTSVALALLTGPARSGAWTGLLGMEHLGWAAAEEMGFPLERVVSVEPPGTSSVSAADSPSVLAAMIDAFDVVVVAAGALPPGQALRRLRARVRERSSLMVTLGAVLPDADARIEVLGTRWEGLGGGWGRLAGRAISVEVGGRGALGRAQRGEILFDGNGGPEVPSVDTEKAADPRVPAPLMPDPRMGGPRTGPHESGPQRQGSVA
ncbi:MAG: hypothetical protein ACK5O2_11930 [Microthrixaceae bacterium]